MTSATSLSSTVGVFGHESASATLFAFPGLADVSRVSRHLYQHVVDRVVKWLFRAQTRCEWFVVGVNCQVVDAFYLVSGVSQAVLNPAQFEVVCWPFFSVSVKWRL